MSSDQLQKADQFFLEKKFSDAIALYDTVLSEDPKNIHAINNKGYALGKLKRHQEAIQCYDVGLKLHPDEKTLLVNKISSLRKTKQYEVALEYCDKILATSPDDNITLYHKERILFAVGNYSESIECCDKILESYPQNSEVLFDKASSLAKLQSDKTLAALDLAVSADPHLKAKAKNTESFAKYNTNQEFLRIVS